MPSVTIGFVPRERFSVAAECLERIFDRTHIPFNLIVVDCNIPATYRTQMEKVLKGRTNVQIIRRDHYLLTNQSKNLVIQEAKDEFLCLIENDNLVEDNWLSKLIAACEDYPADVAVPLLIEGRPGSTLVHFDEKLGHVQQVSGPNGVQLEILSRTIPKAQDRGAARRKVEFMETHCLLFRRNVFDRIGLFDEEINSPEETDLSLALYHAKVPVVFEPKCEIHYLVPYPPNVDELEYFKMRWDVDRAQASEKRIIRKWNLVGIPSCGFSTPKDRNLIGRMHQVKGDILKLISPEALFILVDENKWLGSKIVEDLRALPFLEKDGQYWGYPPDSDTAIRELERLRHSGAGYIVFAWHGFWWLDHYSEFHRYLQSNFSCVLKNELLIVFDLSGKS